MSKTKIATLHRAGFIEGMECLPVSRIPDGPGWTYEILCGGLHKISYMALEVMLRNR
jgi:hypothetical protein